ncbi:MULTISPECIES: DNA-processing protein DprA [unclassified Sporolactobacillus]|uniref:DNA-processing protein DprA n=1 Tax=unclassified Sporolactobacillus TaxID=2628533 RepID=UPI002368EB3C|nr:DNA-processing protein DprA [Sporolactobacillus sp. CQH2019]MDD9147076.1 DNA-processing protein DprA [Sporolactobacillus sp. CQH2019]
MDDLTRKLIQLDHCRGLGRKTISAFLKTDPGLSRAADYSFKELTEIYRMSPVRAEQFLKDFHTFNPERMIQRYERQGISIVSVHSPDYPHYLKKIFDPPHLLYMKGKKERLKDLKMLSVVGTRYPSTEASRIMDYLLTPLIESGWTIVSGLALGIDGLAHALALKGQTIAVLGSGLYFPYPLQHRSLFNELIEHQLVISEYPPPSRPERWRFPERNRVISGLTLGTLVIEAKERSGSLITADQALEQGREVFAVPGSVFKENSKGTHRLIQQGAKLVTQPGDILEELRV